VSPHVGTLSRFAVAVLLAVLLAAHLQFTALPGEANLVTVELARTGPLRIRDAGGGLIAGENCSGGGVRGPRVSGNAQPRHHPE
jgi:hypothetical protein